MTDDLEQQIYDDIDRMRAVMIKSREEKRARMAKANNVRRERDYARENERRRARKKLARDSGAREKAKETRDEAYGQRQAVANLSKIGMVLTDWTTDENGVLTRQLYRES